MYIYAAIIIHNGRFRFLPSMCRLTIDLVVSMELIKQIAFSAKLSKSSEADIVLKERGFTQS